MGGGARWGGAKLLLRVKLLWVAGRGGSGQIASEIVVGGGAGWGKIVVANCCGWRGGVGYMYLHKTSSRLPGVCLAGWVDWGGEHTQ